MKNIHRKLEKKTQNLHIFRDQKYKRFQLYYMDVDER